MGELLVGVAVVTVSFDSNLLLSWYQAKANLAGLASGGNVTGTATASSAAKVPTAPWNQRGATPADSVLVTNALSGNAFIDEKAAKVDVAKANADYKKLFAINQGLSTLQALANAANDSKTPSSKLASIQQAFQRGLGEISNYVETSKFGEFRLTSGIATSSDTSVAGVPAASDTYTTAVLATGSADADVAAFQGNVQFDLTVTKSAATSTKAASTASIHFDLADLGAAPRTMNSVASYINGKLIAAGVGVRVAVDRSQTADQTLTVNGKPVTISAGQTNLAFKLSGLSLQSATFSAPTTAPAVYIAQTAGDPNVGTIPATDGVQQQELVKFEAGSGADAARRPGDQNYVAGRVFSEQLPSGVTTVHATATGADGSVYVVADGSGVVSGQPIKGAQDAVLLKYDAAGNLAYTQTLGAGVSASGLALAVSADGKVAIAGAVTGVLDNGDAGADPKTSDSFVTVFDSKGAELWTQRQGALGADEAQALAFDATGNVYVAGKTQGAIAGGAALGGWDGYLRAYDASGQVQATQQFGSAADDSVAGLVVNGTNVLVAGQDGNAAVVRSFDVTNPKQMTLTASRNLGSLGGGSVGGIGLDGAGNVLIGGSTGANLNLATTTLARGGGADGFGARISADLTSTAADAVAYYGGSGADQATAATVAGGQVWLAGTTKTDLPGLAAVGRQDGFVAALDVGAGVVTYSQRFTAKDQVDAPESIAVDTSGGSALDRLGLPKGTIGTALAPGDSPADPAQSVLLTTATSLRAGDQFQLRVDGASPTTISIAATDTLSTLAAKIQQAGLFEVKVQTLFTGTGTGLQLTPSSDRHTFELLPGAAGRDALTALGLKPGLVRNVVVDKTKGVIPADKGTQTYGLRFTAPLDLNSKADIKTALDGIGNALTVVRAIYADLKQAATPQTAKTAQGAVPAYLQNRIADYQAALDRLTAGGSGANSGSSLASLFG